MNTSHLPNLIIADDHNMLIQLLKKLFLSKGYRVAGTAKNGKEVLRLLKKHPVNIVLMGCAMPIMDGIETTKIISKEYPNTQVLILSMFSKGPCVQKALDAGARGYMHKSSNPEEIEVAIKELLNGNLYLSPAIAEEFMEFTRNDTEEKAGKLSKLEKEMLALLSLGLTSKQIKAELKLSFHTVNNYRRNLMAKFKVNNVTGLIAAARKLGFLA